VLFWEVSEADHRIMNPFSAAKLALVGELCGLDPSSSVLDLCCGKGEMLCTWAATHGVSGFGIDANPGFVEAARARAAELGVTDRVDFEQRDATGFVHDERFDVTACIGATWIGGGTTGAVDLLRRSTKDGGLMLVGELFFHEHPPAGETDRVAEHDTGTLAETVEHLEATGASVIDMVLASTDDWDRYQASQWHNVTTWLDDHADHPQADELRRTNEEWKRAYLAYGRRRWGWGVFILRP
jgi:cyclopropane fatty-acyl-phospholipid synthase-like methyltransferase